MSGLIPVPEQEVTAWCRDLLARRDKRMRTPSAAYYDKLHDILERLWRQTRDQKAHIEGMQEAVAEARKITAKQGKLALT